MKSIHVNIGILCDICFDESIVEKIQQSVHIVKSDWGTMGLFIK